MQTCDTLVIGAGAAGLAAAYELIGAGQEVCVLEARDRIGGRIYDLPSPGYPEPIQLGAEFIHGWAPETWAWVKKLKLMTSEFPDSHAFGSEAGLKRSDDFWEKLDAVMSKLKLEKEPDRSFEEFLREQKDPTWARAFVEGFHAADPKRISALALKHEQEVTESEEGERSFRIHGGYTPILEALAAPARKAGALRLSAPVQEILWSPNQVEARYSGRESISARRALLTLPLPLFKNIRFSPPLGTEKTRAIDALELGPVVKIVLRFREPFWERDLSFMHFPEGEFPTYWTSAPSYAPVLVAWAGGPRAAQLSGHSHAQSHEVWLRSALATLSQGTKIDLGRLRSWLVDARSHDWSADPWSQGAYSYVGVGGMGAREVLAKALQKALFFAGEATDSQGLAGTVEGAIASGKRAACEILAGG